MNTKKKDINLLVAAGVKKGLDFKASSGLIMIIVFVIAIGVMAFMYIGALTSKNGLEAEINRNKQFISDPANLLKIEQLKIKQDFQKEIDDAAKSGNAILDYVGSCKSIYAKLPASEIAKIKARAAGFSATLLTVTYADNTVTLTFGVPTNLSEEIPNISADCISAITDSYKADTVIKPFLDNKLTLLVSEDGSTQENSFMLTGKMQNFYDLVRQYAGIEIKDFIFTSKSVTFSGIAGIATNSPVGEKDKARDRVDAYAMLLKNNGKPLYFASVTATGQGNSSSPAVSYGKNPNTGVDFTYYTYSFTCTL